VAGWPGVLDQIIFDRRDVIGDDWPVLLKEDILGRNPPLYRTWDIDVPVKLLERHRSGKDKAIALPEHRQRVDRAHSVGCLLNGLRLGFAEGLTFEDGHFTAIVPDNGPLPTVYGSPLVPFVRRSKN
jgi:hypothetical protein